jgi:hypothetical protein
VSQDPLGLLEYSVVQQDVAVNPGHGIALGRQVSRHRKVDRVLLVPQDVPAADRYDLAAWDVGIQYGLVTEDYLHREDIGALLG